MRWAAPWAALAAVLLAACAHKPEWPLRPADVRICVCTDEAGLEQAQAAGFDYGELGVSALARLPPVDLEKALIQHRLIGLPTPVANAFLPADVRVTGPDARADEQLAYVRTAFSRIVRFGVKIIVFDSAAARDVPAGFPREQAFVQLVDFGKRVAPEAASRGLTVALLPLRRQDSNIINNAAEALQVVRAVGHPAFQLAIDFFHLASEKDDPDVLLRARGEIRHLHIANPDGRAYPLESSEYDYHRFFENIRRIGFQGGLTVDAQPKNGIARDGPVSVGFLRARMAGP